MRKAGIAVVVVVCALSARGHAQKGVNVFTAVLAGANEVPLVSSPAQGTFRAEIDEAAQVVHYELTYSGFATAVRQSHIHIAQPFASGAIMVWLCDSASNPAPLPVDVPPCPQGEGTVTGTITASDVGTASSAQGVAPGEFDEFIAAIRGGNAYANVHSTQSQGGEIRGQIKPGNGPK
jgi:CHRD domain-containing protein